MPKLIKILENPPQRRVECKRCSGRGYINPTGMISSDKCPRCRGSKKQWVTNWAKFERLIREHIAEE